MPGLTTRIFEFSDCATFAGDLAHYGRNFYGARFQEVAVTASPLAARPRSLGALAAAALIVAVLGVLPPVTTGWLTRLFTEVALLSDDEVGWIMGGTGFALPGQDYVDLINQNYFGGAGFWVCPLRSSSVRSSVRRRCRMA